MSTTDRLVALSPTGRAETCGEPHKQAAMERQTASTSKVEGSQSH